jgi:endo-1,4-beta-mannosidase
MFDNTGNVWILTPKIDVYNNGFVYVKGDKLMLGSSPYYVNGMNYVFNLNQHNYTPDNTITQGTFFLSRFKNECTWDQRCNQVFNYPKWQELLLDDADIDADFARISAQGYNTLRIVGGLDFNDDPTSSTGGLVHGAIRDSLFSPPSSYLGWGVYSASYQIPDNVSTNTYPYIDGIVIPKLQILLQKAANHGLKVIYLAGFNGINRQSAWTNYGLFLARIANYFKNDPTLMAFDIVNEPDWEPSGDVWKPQVCSLTYDLYTKIRNTGSKALITYGNLAPNNTFIWDPGLISADFFSPHLYCCDPNGSCGPDLAQRLDNIKSTIIYYSEIFAGKPWLAGETGFSSDFDATNRPDMGSLAD